MLPQDIKIIPRGINLLPPGDQVAEGDCLELSGFWPGSAGRLQQAKGFVLKNAVAGNPAFQSLAESDGKIFWGDTGGNLYEGSQDGATVAAIDTGYDGYPLGMCAYQHVLWVMNRSKQRRVGTGPSGPVPLSDWGAASSAPSLPSGVMAAGGGLADGDHTYFVTFVDQYGYETNPSPALKLTAPSLPVPGFGDGTVALTNGSTAVVLTPSATAGWTSAIDGQQFLIPSEYPTVNPPDPAPYRIAFVDATHGTLSAAWAGVNSPTAVYQIYSVSNSGKATITRPNSIDPTVTAGGFWNVYHQSPGINGPYQVNAFPLGYGAVGSDPNQTSASTFVDYGDTGHGEDDNTLLAADLLMEANHDPPPDARVLASRPYNGRLVVANSAEHPNRVWYTNSLEPNFFPGSGNPQAGNWVDIGDDTSDAILHLSVRQSMMIFYRQRSIWRVVGDFEDANSVIAPLVPNMGIVGPNAVVGTSNGDIAVVKQGLEVGLYRVTDWEQRISAKIEPILNGMGSENYGTINTAALSTCALGYKLGRLWFSYPEGSNTYPSRILLCDVEQDSFSYTVAGRWFSRNGGFGAFLHGSLFFLGATVSNIFSVEDGPSENGSPVSLAYESGYIDCGNPDHEKTYGDLVISHYTGNAPLAVTARVNKNTASYLIATIQSTVTDANGKPIPTRQVIPFVYPNGQANAGEPIEGFNVSIRIAGNGPTSSPGAFIDTPMLLHYFLKPRRQMVWDSGPTDHGITGAKLVDALEIDGDLPSGLTLFIQSDIPGGVLVERSIGGVGMAIASTAGRQLQRIIFPPGISPISGRVLRYQLFATGLVPTAFLLYRVRMRVLPVGVYVDGTFGDTWYTEPIAAGTSGVAPVYEAARRERLPQEV